MTAHAHRSRPAAASLSKQQQAMLAPTVRELAEQGKTDSQIVAYFAKHGPFAASVDQVRRIRRNHGIVSLNDPRRNSRVQATLVLSTGIREAFVSRVRDLAAEGMSDAEISAALGRGLSKHQVYHLRKTYGIKPGRSGPLLARRYRAANGDAGPELPLATVTKINTTRERRIKLIPGMQAHCRACDGPVDAYTNNRAPEHMRLADVRAGGVYRTLHCEGSKDHVVWRPAEADELETVAA